MPQANGSVESAERKSLLGAAVGAAGRAVRRFLLGDGFRSSDVLPFVASGLLVVRPIGWLPLLAAVFAANVVGALAGHCYSREC